MTPVAMTIAGSDASSGAGLQAESHPVSLPLSLS